MDAESEFFDEVMDRLTTIYNKIRMNNSDIGQAEKVIAKCDAENAQLEARASYYEAFFATSESEGTPA